MWRLSSRYWRTAGEQRYSAKEVAEFLTRCIFTSFAEDVGLLPDRAWLNLLESLRNDASNFPPVIESLWKTMNDGGFSPVLRSHLLQFNGGLFASTSALPLNRDQIGLLIEAASSRWRDVEPAIFGTLLERADAFHFGVLSSRVHVCWALAAGGTLEDRPRYNKTRCFDTFPFPNCTEEQKETIRAIAERLDAHRKRQQSLHPELTLTEMYNVLEKTRAREELTAEDRRTYDAGLIGVLCELHDELGTEVFAAYGWPADLSDEEILSNVVSLNAQRIREEREGMARWLRPEYQAPGELAVQTALAGVAPVAGPAPARRKLPWPPALTDQVRAIKDALRATPMQSVQQIAASFRPASRTRIAEILETLTALGQTRQIDDRYLL